MTVAVNDVCGLKIYVLEEGMVEGEVVALTYDLREAKVRSLLVKYNSSIEEVGAIMIQGIISFGVDAVIVESKRQLIKLRDVKEDLGEILKDPDTRFDTKTGKIELGSAPKYFSEIKDK